MTNNGEDCAIDRVPNCRQIQGIVYVVAGVVEGSHGTVVVTLGAEESEACALLPKPHRLPATSPLDTPHKGSPHPWETAR